MKVLGFVTEPAVVRRILAHLDMRRVGPRAGPWTGLAAAPGDGPQCPRVDSGPHSDDAGGSNRAGAGRRADESSIRHMHRCRHTFAMRWLAAGGNLVVLQQILGHRELSTTMRYARVPDDSIEREAERVRAQRGGA